MIQNICAIVGAVTGVISLLWTFFQHKEIQRMRDNISLKDSGYVGSGAKAGRNISGRDINE